MTAPKSIEIRQPDAETRDVPGYEGLYAVTADGRVWTHAKSMGVSRHGGRWLKAAMSSPGYPMVALFKDKKQLCARVHRLLAAAWIPNPGNLPDINHINGIKADNRIENLEWCTRSQNNQHAVDTGLRRYGELSDEIVNTVRRMAAAGTKQKDIAAQYSISKSVVCMIVKKRIYRRVPAAQPQV